MAEAKLQEKKRFSLVKRAKSFTHAGRGIWIFLKSTHNAWIQLALLTCAVGFGFYFKIGGTEWLALALASGLVLTAEAVNTAIELGLDFVSPAYHRAARDAKDVAAGAALISALTAIVVGAIIFLPRIAERLR
jgi:diacylglycerol kinase (ATP)